jgi:hypothetical protein
MIPKFRMDEHALIKATRNLPDSVKTGEEPKRRGITANLAHERNYKLYEKSSQDDSIVVYE